MPLVTRMFLLGHVGLHAGVPIGLGQRRGFSGLSGQAFPCAGALHERYRKFLGNAKARFTLAPPPEQEDRGLWQQFARQTLGFVPSAAFVADRGRQLRWWQEFLARRHAGISSLNAAYGTNWPDFAAVPIPAELPTNETALRDWLQFEGVALPMHRTAHAFSVLLPATRRGATESDVRLRGLRIVRIKAVLRLVTRVMANSDPEGEAHAESLLGPERARIP